MGGSEVNLFDVVGGSPLGEDISTEDCEVLSEIVRLRQLLDNEILFEEGAVEDTVYLIVKGRVAVTKGGMGQATTLHVLEKGDLAGELSFVDGTPHSATLVALGEAEVVALERQRFEALIETNPHLVYHVMRTIVRKVHSTLKRMNMQYIEMANYITKTHGRY